MVSLPVRIGLLTAVVLAVAIALVAMLDAMSFARARADAQRATVGWAVHELTTAGEAGLVRGVPIASTAEALAPLLKTTLEKDASLRWIALADREGRLLASAGTHPDPWPDALVRPVVRSTTSELAGLHVLLSPLTGVADREGVLAVAYDRAPAQADATAFTIRLAWLSLLIWCAASLLLTALLAWAARTQLGQLRHMEAALAGGPPSGDPDLDATIARLPPTTAPSSSAPLPGLPLAGAVLPGAAP